MDDKTPNEAIAKIGLELARGFQQIGEALAEAAEKIGEIIREFVEILRTAKPRQKYKPVKSLVKPYKAPYIKIRYNARSNI